MGGDGRQTEFKSVELLKRYFEETSKEQIERDWVDVMGGNSGYKPRLGDYIRELDFMLDTKKPYLILSNSESMIVVNTDSIDGNPHITNDMVVVRVLFDKTYDEVCSIFSVWCEIKYKHNDLTSAISEFNEWYNNINNN